MCIFIVYELLWGLLLILQLVVDGFRFCEYRSSLHSHWLRLRAYEQLNAVLLLIGSSVHQYEYTLLAVLEEGFVALVGQELDQLLLFLEHSGGVALYCRLGFLLLWGGFFSLFTYI
jgi:hypothetical protein